MEWLIVLACLFLIVLVPIGICVQYDQGAARLWLVAGPFHFSVYPRENRHKKQRIAAGTTNKDRFESHAQVKKKKRKLADYFPLIQLVFDFLVDFRTKLRINNLRLKVILAGGDPCDLSVNYGRAWAALGTLMPLLERCFVIKRRCLQIECDYTAESTVINAHLKMTITVGHIIMIASYHGIKMLRKYFQIVKNAKDGATS